MPASAPNTCYSASCMNPTAPPRNSSCPWESPRKKLRQELKASPEPANRDWLTRPEPAAPGDPSTHELEAVLSAAPLPSPDLPARESSAPAAEVPVRIPDVRLESPVVERQLEALQILVCGLGGALIGSALISFLGVGPAASFIGMAPAAFCGCIVGVVLVSAKSNFLARVVGLAAGSVYGCLHAQGKILVALLLAALGGGFGLLLGWCLGDWRKLMGSETLQELADKKANEAFTPSESAVQKTVETFTEQT